MIQGAENVECCCLFLSSPFLSTLLLPLSFLYLSPDNGSFSLLYFFLCLPYISPQTTVHSLYFTSSSVFLISLLRQRFILSTLLLPLSSLYLSSDNGSFSLLSFFLCLPYISPQTTVHSLYFTSSSVFLISLLRQRFILSTLLLPLSSLYLSSDNGSFSLLYFFLCLPYISPHTTVHSLYFTSSSVFLISLLRQRFILSTLLLPLSSLYLSSDNGSFSLLYFFLCLPYISPQTTVHSLYFTSSSVFLISLLRQRFILSTSLLPLSSLYLSSHNGSFSLLYFFLCLPYISPQTTVHSLYFTSSSVFLISLLRQRFILSTSLLPLSSLYLSSDNGSFSLLHFFLCLPYISPQTTVHSLYFTSSSVFLISLLRQRFILSTLLLPLSSLYLSSSDNGSFSLLYFFLCLSYNSPQTTVHSLYFTSSSVFLISLLRQRFILSTLLLLLSSLYLSSSDNGSFCLLYFFLCLSYISPQTTVHSLYFTSSSVFLISLLRQRFILSTLLLPLSFLYLSSDNGSFSLLYFFLCLPYISPLQTTVHSLYFTSSSVFLISLLFRQRFILSTLLLPLSSLYLSSDNGSFSLLYFFLCLPYISPQTTVHSLYFTSSSVFLISLLRQRFILSTLLLPLSSLYLSSDNGSFSLLYSFLCLPYISPQTTVHSLYLTSSSVFLISLPRQRFILSTLLLPLSSLYLSSDNGSYGPCFLYKLFHVLRFSNQLNEGKEQKKGISPCRLQLMETTRHLAALIIQQWNYKHDCFPELKHSNGAGLCSNVNVWSFHHLRLHLILIKCEGQDFCYRVCVAPIVRHKHVTLTSTFRMKNRHSIMNFNHDTSYAIFLITWFTHHPLPQGWKKKSKFSASFYNGLLK